MTPTILAVRAVTSLYARQILRTILTVGLLIYAVVLAVVILLTTELSPWWLLLGVLPTFIFLIGLVLWLIAWALAKRLAPTMNLKQKRATKKVVSNISSTADQLGMSRFFLLFRVIKDVIFPPQNNRTFISELADTPGKLKRDFENLRRLF